MLETHLKKDRCVILYLHESVPTDILNMERDSDAKYIDFKFE